MSTDKIFFVHIFTGGGDNSRLSLNSACYFDRCAFTEPGTVLHNSIHKIRPQPWFLVVLEIRIQVFLVPILQLEELSNYFFT